MDQPVRHHPMLGELRWDAPLSWWTAEVELVGGHYVVLRLCAEKEHQVIAMPDELFAAGVAYLTWVRSAETRCRQQIADDLLDCYNEVWANQGADDPSDAPPPMTREQFLNRIQLSAIHLHIGGTGAWYYDDEDLFGGHSIEVWVSAERVFSGAHLAG